MVIEAARNLLGLPDAASTEFEPDTHAPVIATMAEQVDTSGQGDMGATMRLGAYPAELVPGSAATVRQHVHGASGTATATR